MLKEAPIVSGAIGLPRFLKTCQFFAQQQLIMFVPVFQQLIMITDGEAKMLAKNADDGDGYLMRSTARGQLPVSCGPTRNACTRA